MSMAEAHDHGHAHDAHGHSHGGGGGFMAKLKHIFFTYGWSTDHKMIGKQFLFSGLAFLIIGGLLALGVRWQLAWPGTSAPIIGVIDGAKYNMLFTMHASIMIFFVIIPLLGGAFGNYLIPLQIGARDMAFPWLNALSYWIMPPTIIMVVGASLSMVAPRATAGRHIRR